MSSFKLVELKSCISNRDLRVHRSPSCVIFGLEVKDMLKSSALIFKRLGPLSVSLSRSYRTKATKVIERTRMRPERSEASHRLYLMVMVLIPIESHPLPTVISWSKVLYTTV